MTNCLDAADAARKILKVADHFGSPQILWSGREVVCEKDIFEHLQEGRLKCVRDNIRGNILDVPIGVTGADGGIAETGTILLNCSLETTRLISSLPSVHMVILSSGRIVPALEDAISLWDINGGRRSKSLWTFISGPSKTECIEGIRAHGVHGPRELHILIL